MIEHEERVDLEGTLRSRRLMSIVFYCKVHLVAVCSRRDQCPPHQGGSGYVCSYIAVYPRCERFMPDQGIEQGTKMASWSTMGCKARLKAPFLATRTLSAHIPSYLEVPYFRQHLLTSSVTLNPGPDRQSSAQSSTDYVHKPQAYSPSCLSMKWQRLWYIARMRSLG